MFHQQVFEIPLRLSGCQSEVVFFSMPGQNCDSMSLVLVAFSKPKATALCFDVLRLIQPSDQETYKITYLKFNDKIVQMFKYKQC